MGQNGAGKDRVDCERIEGQHRSVQLSSEPPTVSSTVCREGAHLSCGAKEVKDLIHGLRERVSAPCKLLWFLLLLHQRLCLCVVTSQRDPAEHSAQLSSPEKKAHLVRPCECGPQRVAVPIELGAHVCVARLVAWGALLGRLGRRLEP